MNISVTAAAAGTGKVAVANLLNSAAQALTPDYKAGNALPPVEKMRAAQVDATNAVDLLKDLAATGDMFDARNARSALSLTTEGLTYLRGNLNAIENSDAIVNPVVLASNNDTARNKFTNATDALWME